MVLSNLVRSEVIVWLIFVAACCSACGLDNGVVAGLLGRSVVRRLPRSLVALCTKLRHAAWIEVWLGVSAKEEYIWVLQICSFRRPLRSRFDYKPVDLVSPDGGVEGALVAKDVTGKREATTTSFLELSFMLMEPGRSSLFF